MKTYETQKKEIETIRERNLSLNLSDADVERISETAGHVGLTVSELLQNFIGDLVDGTYSNGSDERMYAEQWFDRCWFAHYNDTFLRYLLDMNMVEEVVEDWEEIKHYEQNPKEQEDYQDVYDEAKERIDELFSEFIEESKYQRELKLEKEMEKVIKWWNDYQQLSAISSR